MAQTREDFFKDLLISIHTCRWTGNSDRFVAYLDAIAAYSYAHTNSNLGDTDDKWDKAYDRLVARCEEIGYGNYKKTTPEYVLSKRQLKIPFPDFKYSKFE